jgi:uncharacterized protein with HEPN domain
VKDERVYLGHIRDAINDIEQYTSAGRDYSRAVDRQSSITRAPGQHRSERLDRLYRSL